MEGKEFCWFIVVGRVTKHGEECCRGEGCHHMVKSVVVVKGAITW